MQEKGEVKSLEGAWTFDELGEGRTRATYSLATDPGLACSDCACRPGEDMARNFPLGSAAEGLKERAESG